MKSTTTSNQKPAATTTTTTLRHFWGECAYDGTQYAGFQLQPDRPTIQGTLENAVRLLTGQFGRVLSAGRTDSGVHAKAMVIGFSVATTIPAERMPAALNRYLPDDIYIRLIREADSRIIPRYRVERKIYTYTVQNAPEPDLFTRRYRLWLKEPLNLGRLRRLARIIRGTHDMGAFTTADDRSPSKVKTIHQITIRRRGPTVQFRYTGSGFLHKMIRILTGTLIACGREPDGAARLRRIRDSRDPSLAGRFCLSGHGLCLEKVIYRPGCRY